MESETKPARQREVAEATPAATPAPVDWGDDEPDEVWLDLYKRGLVRPPYRDWRNRPDLSELPPRIRFTGTDEDLLRALGRL